MVKRNVAKPSLGRNGAGPIASVSRVFNVLEFLALSDSALSLAEISKELHLAPSTAHRFLRALIVADFVRQDPRTNTYEATLKLFNLGSMVIAKFHLSERLVPVLRKIAWETEDAASLVLREGLEGILLERIEGRGVQVFAKYRRVPLYCTAAGKAILSLFDENSLAKYFASTKLAAKTPHTITKPSELRSELEKIRREGVSLDHEEAEMGARCVAVPLTLATELMAAVSVSALAPKMTDRRMREIAALIKQAISEAGLLFTSSDSQIGRATAEAGGD